MDQYQVFGEKAAKSIHEASKDGEFKTKEDLKVRAKIGDSVIDSLDSVGALKDMPDSDQLSIFELNNM